ncbi:MAG: hypothetical protein ACW968_01330 [Candidatus Thorarchaeota archaeon]
MTRYRAGGLRFFNLTIKNDLVVENDATIENDLTVENDATIENDLAIDSDLTVGNDATIENDLEATKVKGTFDVLIVPAIATGVNQSNGNVIEGDGSIYFNVNDYLYLFLSGLVPSTLYGANIRIDSYTVYCNTTTNAAYLVECDLWNFDLTNGGKTQLYNGSQDIGNGTSGDDSYTYPSVNETLSETCHYFLNMQFGGLGGANAITIYGVMIHCSLI